jgi:hypothetical protein
MHLLNGFAHCVAVHALPNDAAAFIGSAVDGVEPAYVVEPGDMIHVCVGEDNRIDLVDPVFKACFAHFWGRVE